MMTKRGKCFEYDLNLYTKKASHCNKSTMLVCCLSTEYAYVKGARELQDILVLAVTYTCTCIYYMDSIPSHMSSNVDKHYPTIIHVKYKNDKIFYYT